MAVLEKAYNYAFNIIPAKKKIFAERLQRFWYHFWVQVVLNWCIKEAQHSQQHLTQSPNKDIQSSATSVSVQ